MTIGEEKFKEVGEKLKAELNAKKSTEEKSMTSVLNQLAQIAQNSEMASLYAESAKLGAENLGGELPLLKIHAVGRSTSNELLDGSEPTDGYFFYKPTQEQFKSVDCHILTISRGFRAKGIDKNNPDKEIFNQIVGGVIVKSEEMIPFIMYFTGTKLNNLWEFGKSVNKYTHLKPVPMPLFTLKVRLTTEKITTDFGKNWIVKFELVKNEDGSPEIILDKEKFLFLRDHVGSIEDTISNLIDRKAVEEIVETTELKSEGNNGSEDIPF